MIREVSAVEVEEWVRDIQAAPPPTRDDQTLLRDGRVLDTKAKVLQFFAECGLVADERPQP